jgi:hypothetical protein
MFTVFKSRRPRFNDSGNKIQALDKILTIEYMNHQLKRIVKWGLGGVMGMGLALGLSTAPALAGCSTNAEGCVECGPHWGVGREIVRPL